MRLPAEGVLNTIPLHQAKAELFRTLGHPLRVRVLELLVEEPRPVQELLRELKIEPSNLSQQLAVLRRAGLVTVTRQGTSAVYAVSTPQVGALLAAGRQILAAVLRDTENLLAELRETS